MNRLMSGPKHLSPPLLVEDLKGLMAGDIVLISGTIYTGRDTAHKRLIELLDQGKERKDG